MKLQINTQDEERRFGRLSPLKGREEEFMFGLSMFVASAEEAEVPGVSAAVLLK